MDAAGNLFIADPRNNQVRMVTPDGRIWNIAGGGVGLSGDSGPAIQAVLGGSRGIAVDRSGNIFVADTGGRVRKHTPDVKPATNPR